MRKVHIKKTSIFARKWIVILIIAAILIVFGRTVDNKSLSQSAIVVGLGIDYVDDEFSVSAQSVSVTGSAAQDSPSQSFVTFSDKGKTLTEALDKIGQKMGLIVSLSHCNVVFLSKNSLMLDHVSLLMPLFTSLSLPEQCVILATEDVTAVLSAQTATTVSAPFYFQSALFQKTDNGGVTRVTAKDFLANSLSRSGAVCLPFVTMKKMEEQPIAAEQTSSDNMEFDLSKNIAVAGKRTLSLNEEQSRAISLFLAQNPKDKLLSTLPTGESFEFRILNKKGKAKANGFMVNADFEFNLSFLEAKLPYSADIDCTSQIVTDAANLLANKLKEAMNECFALSKEYGMDILLLENKVYQSYGRALPENCFSKIELDVSVKMSVTENS